MCGRAKQKTEKKEDGKDVDDDEDDEAEEEAEEGAVATCSGGVANEFWFQQDLCVE